MSLLEYSHAALPHQMAQCHWSSLPPGTSSTRGTRDELHNVSSSHRALPTPGWHFSTTFNSLLLTHNLLLGLRYHTLGKQILYSVTNQTLSLCQYISFRSKTMTKMKHQSPLNTPPLHRCVLREMYIGPTGTQHIPFSKLLQHIKYFFRLFG